MRKLSVVLCFLILNFLSFSQGQSKKEIQLFLEEKEIKLLSDDIKILEPIRSLGEHIIEVNPYEGINEKIKVFVKKN